MNHPSRDHGLIRFTEAGSDTSSPIRPAERRSRSPRPACWRPPGEPVQVHGYRIADGMVYVGRDLAPVTSYFWLRNEPALLDPSLPVDPRHRNRASKGLFYRPVYQNLSPANRAAHLEWLADGRRDPKIPVGHLFMFLYGLERRLLWDLLQHSDAETVGDDGAGEGAAEAERLLGELDRLLAIYGRNRSFRDLAESLRTTARVLHGLVGLGDLEPPPGPPWALGRLSQTTRLALGRYLADGEPIPARWAWHWWGASERSSVRTAARRCPREFEELFLAHFEELHPQGLEVRRPRRTLEIECVTANPALSSTPIPAGRVLDISGLRAPLTELGRLAERVYGELDAYSRWVGQQKDRTSLAALALLPPEMVRRRSTAASRQLLETLETALEAAAQTAVGPRAEGPDETAVAVLEVEALQALWPPRAGGRWTARDTEGLRAFLAAHGWGLEPDPSWGGPSAFQGDKVVVFQLGNNDPADADCPDVDSENDAPAHRSRLVIEALFLHVATALAASDGSVSPIEARLLATRVARIEGLSPLQRRRLGVHLAWLLAEQPGLGGVKRRLDELDDDARATVGRFALLVAAEDGRVTPETIRLLRKLYPWLGLDADRVYSDLHALGSGASEADPRTTSTTAAGVATPDGAEAPGFQLDPDRIAAKHQESRRVAAILTEVFEDEALEDEAPDDGDEQDDDRGPEAAGTGSGATESSSPLPGLDPLHTTLLERLIQRPEWSGDELATLCDELGLLPAGALEVINEAAFEALGDPLVEGDDPVEVDLALVAEL